MNFSVAVLLLASCLVQGSEIDDSTSVRRRTQSQFEDVECVVIQEDDFGENSNFDKWYCSDSDGQLYEINRPDSWFRAKGIESGTSLMMVKGAEKSRGTFQMPPKVKISSDNSVKFRDAGSRRRLAPTSGTNSMLVIRGVSGDGQPTRTVGALADDVFGSLVGGSDPVNLASQYDACSGGQLTFEPATGTNIQDGAVEINIPDNLNGMNRITAHNLFIEKAAAVVGAMNQWDQIFLVMQNNVDFEGAAAYAYINSWLSVYMDGYASMVVVQMHEIGHNLGLYHSGEVSTYDDHTCMMGNPAYEDDSTVQCFNGAKSWYLNWYADRQTTVAPTVAAWEGLIAGVNDYVSGETSSLHSVVVKIDVPSTSTDLYAMYNKKEGVNSQVKEYGDTVTLVSASNGSTSGQSYILAHMAQGEEYRSSNFGGSGNDMVVKVCAITSGTPDTARVIMYVEGLNDITCDGPATPAPLTGTPTVAPITASPTKSPVSTNPIASPVSAAPVSGSPTKSPVTSAPTTGTPSGPPVTSAPVTPSPTDGAVCVFCPNGDECCSDFGVCSDSGKPSRRGCVPTNPQCPICGNGDECCDGFCETGGKKSNRACVAGTQVAAVKTEQTEQTEQTEKKCFSGFNTVVVQGKGKVRMEALQIGDFVETSQGFSRVFSFGHLDRDAPTSFLKIHAGDNELEVTEEHILFANNGEMVRAGDIVKGDLLGESKVESIDIVQRKGFYAPSTEAGELHVSGIRASCYASLLNVPVWMQHVATHMFYAPLRIVCSVDFSFCAEETYDALGFSKYLSTAAIFATKLQGQSQWIQGAVIATGLPILATVQVVEQPSFSLPILVSLAAASFYLFRSKDTKKL